MKNLYTLTCYDTKSNFYLEKINFTSKKIAIKSLDNLIIYLMWNYSLKKKELFKASPNVITYFLDGNFNVSLTTFTIETTPLKYN